MSHYRASPGKTYVVEDHEDMRFLLKRVLTKSLPLARLVGESDTGEKALSEIPELHPDLVLVDISLPGMDGIELIRRLRPSEDMACILVVTGHDIDLYRADALEAGADDIVSKSDLSELYGAIHRLFGEGQQHG